MMEKPKIYNNAPYTQTEVESGHMDPNVRPGDELNLPESMPVHNYSIQTGEEFALEFMRAGVNPKFPCIPYTSSDPSLTTGYLELKGILGISHTGSEGSEFSTLNLFKDKKCKISSLYEDRCNNGSIQSGLSDHSSTRIKVLCSFSGKILPRPSDGKLRYVGGDTRIIRIHKDISWTELWQKLVAIYYEVHMIKYQLPGEDLDALVSVSCDEDLTHMMEECNVLGGGDGFQKLRMFLFSVNDLDDVHSVQANPTVDSEIQYVVAVNGMDMVSNGVVMSQQVSPTEDQKSDSEKEKTLNVKSEFGSHLPPRDSKKADHNDNNTTEIANSALDLIDLSYHEPPTAPTQRVFHSLKIPRDQLESLSRLTKSDDSLGSQFIMNHSRSDIAAHSLVMDNTEAVIDLTPPVIDDNVTRKNENHGTGDIIIDINDRFPRDFLTDIFTEAIISDVMSDAGQIQNDGSVLSMNIANHEPKHCSYFQKLADDEFHQNVGEGDMGFSTVLPAVDEDGSSRSFREENKGESLSTIGTETAALKSNYIPSGVEFTEGLKVDDTKTEEGIATIDLPSQDSFLSNFDISSVQIISNEDLEELRELGAGSFGTVYHGKWGGTDVAIKRIKESCFAGRSSEQERLTLEFWREADILSKLHHPNVVAFYGVVQDGPGGTLATVAEFMVDGSLRHVLLRKYRQLDHRKKLIIAMDAAFGMEYLHSKNIVHFDLKCDNLLVNLKDPSRPICKVADFGMSKIKRNTLVSGGVRGTLPWMAPELLNGGSNKVSEKVDVFSFGIVLWEILTGEEPYANMHYGAIIGGMLNNTLRPNVPNWCDHEWKVLMEQCWAPNPMIRPTFTEITRRLRFMSIACHKAQAQKAAAAAAAQ